MKNNLENTQLLLALKEFNEASKKLAALWINLEDGEGDEMTQDYPFEGDFYELSMDIDKWTKTQVDLFPI